MEDTKNGAEAALGGGKVCRRCPKGMKMCRVAEAVKEDLTGKDGISDWRRAMKRKESTNQGKRRSTKRWKGIAGDCAATGRVV